jgi:hypothetical protein
VLFACHPTFYSLNAEDFETVIRVELIYYNNPDAKTMKRNPDITLPSFDFDKIEIIETLREERIDAFIKEFSNFSLFNVSEHLDSPQGISLRLIRENGDFMIVCCRAEYSAWLDSYGNVTYFIGSGAYNVRDGNWRHIRNFINRYFDTQL